MECKLEKVLQVCDDFFCSMSMTYDGAVLWSPSITDDDDFPFNVENMTQHEEEESMC